MSSNDTTDTSRDTSRRARLKRWLATPRATRWLVALGVLLTLPSLASGLVADDYLHAITLRGLPFPQPQAGPFDLFRFANGDLRTARALMDVGQFPWPADPACRFAFFRPLAAATHVLDYALWPGSPWLMHAQNLAWFALALVAVAAAYRRFLGATWVAGLALLLYAVDDTHAQSVGWIANRNALIALVLGLPVLILHDRWRREGWTRGAWLAPLLLGAALLAGESAIAVVAYLAAYELHLDRGAWRARLISLAPYLPSVVAWRVLYTALGYGVSGSGIYLDPARHPLAYLKGLPGRLPFLLLGEFAFPRSDLGEVYEYVSPSATRWMIGVAVVVLALVAAAMTPLWRRDRTARFFATGLLLAALPVCAGFPSDRLLLFVSVGGMGLVAQLISTAEGLPVRVAATFLAIVHLVFAPPLLAVKSRFLDYAGPNEMADATIPRTPDIAAKTLVLVNPPNDLFYVFLPASRMVRGIPFPARIRGLAPVTTAVDVTRVDARTLRIRPSEGYIEHEPERMLRSLDTPFVVGSTIDLPGMTGTVTEVTADRRPAEMLFRFDAPLEDPSLVWFYWTRDGWTRDGYAPWPLPAIGETVHLPAHDVRRAVLSIEDLLSGHPPAPAPSSQAAVCPATWTALPLPAPALAAPEPASRVVAHMAASGTQNYQCVAQAADGGGGFAWTFLGPEATLTDCHGSPLGRHFASDAGPTAPKWEAKDGSFVVAKKIASAPAKEAGAVAWLLLQATATGGSGTLGGTRFVQRTATAGGAPPPGGCDAAHAGAVVKVPYAAEYWFLGE
jgi:hypothetical protein